MRQDLEMTKKELMDLVMSALCEFGEEDIDRRITKEEVEEWIDEKLGVIWTLSR